MRAFRWDKRNGVAGTARAKAAAGSSGFFEDVDDLRASRQAQEDANAAAHMAFRHAAEEAVRETQAAGREFGAKARALELTPPPGGWRLSLSAFYGFDVRVQAEGDTPIVCDGYKLDADILMRMVAKDSYATVPGFKEAAVRAMANILKTI